jgi:MFS family permease
LASSEEAEALSGAGEAFSGRSRRFTLVMVTLVYVVNYLDRNILTILLPYIKAEFHLTNFAVGLLGGTSFAIFYATLAMPIAWIADRANRRNVIAVSMLLFSAMTVVCGYAANFLQLVGARILTGVGEAGTGPAISSILSDLYPPKERAGALSFYAAGLNIGLLIAFFGGGVIEQHFGWRNAFLASGIPGLLLAFLFVFSVPEPPRGHVEQLQDSERAPSFVAAATYMWSLRSFRWISIGGALSAFGGYAGVNFVPIFLAQSHHMTASQIGLALSLLTGVAGGLGTYFSGVFADRLGKRNVRWNMYVPVIMILASLPFLPFYFLSPSLPVVLLCAIIPSAVGASYLAPCLAMTQGLVPLRMRAQAAAIMLFILNIIGYGTGPASVGLLSDVLKPVLHEDALRWALLSTIIPWIMSAYCYWRASRTLPEELARGSGIAPVVAMS